MTARYLRSLPLLSLGLAAPSAVWAADCPQPTNAEQILGDAAGIERAWQAADAVGVLRAEATLRADLACAGEALDVATSAALHRAEGLARWVDKDEEGASRAFRAARALDPDADLDARLVPDGHPLRALYLAAGSGGGTRIDAWPPMGDALWVDGARSIGIPDGRSSVVQVLDGRDIPVWSGYNSAGGLPAGAGLSATPPLPPPTQKRRPTVALLSGAGAALLGSGALYALSASSANTFKDPDALSAAERDDTKILDGLYARNHAEVFGSAGLGALGLGLGVAGLLTVSW